MSVSGYRIRFPTSTTAAPSSVLVGEQREATVIEKGQVILRDRDEWQSLDITGDGSRVTVTLNGIRVGVFGLEEFGGYILFDDRKDRVQLRNITIASTEPTPEISSEVITFRALKKAGGQMARLVHNVRPNYTIDAMREKVQGVVAMDAVVLADGSVGTVRVTRSLHPDLDLSAIAAVRAWRFEPAMLNGQPVPLVVQVELSFTLR